MSQDLSEKQLKLESLTDVQNQLNQTQSYNMELMLKIQAFESEKLNTGSSAD